MGILPTSGVGHARQAVGRFQRNDRDRCPPASVVTDSFFPPPFPGKPLAGASVDDIKAWNEAVLLMLGDGDPLAFARVSSISSRRVLNLGGKIPVIV